MSLKNKNMYLNKCTYSSLKNICILIARLINDNETISSLGKRNYKQYTIKAMTGNPKWFLLSRELTI